MNDLLPDKQTLSLKDKIGQMLVVRASGHLFDHQIRYPLWEPTAPILRSWLQELNLGGVILLGGSAAEIAFRTKELQSWSRIPLLIAADVEEGVGQRFAGASWFPPPMAIGAIAKQNPSLAQEYATKMGMITAQEAVGLGINWLLAPVVDINSNPDNPVINVRSFADNPELVSDLATAFIEGAATYPVLTTAKHFPGHGDTDIDSHLHLPFLSHSDERLRQVELIPFQRVIAAGVHGVMSAHLLVKVWDSHNPATLSSSILTEQLRHNLGFSGLIVTDALIMGAIAHLAPPEEVAVRAIAAGADILLMPSDPQRVITGILEAVNTGLITEERINQSLERIWHAKAQVLSHTNSTESLYFLLSLSQTQDTIQQILRLSSCQEGNLPLQPPPNQLRNLIIVDDLLNCDFLHPQTPSVAIPQQLGYQLQLLDQNSLSAAQASDNTTLLQVFVRGGPFRGYGGLTPQAQAFYRQLFEDGLVHGLLIYGSPYVWEWFRDFVSADLPAVFSYGQMPQSQATALETLFGSLPPNNFLTFF